MRVFFHSNVISLTHSTLSYLHHTYYLSHILCATILMYIIQSNILNSLISNLLYHINQPLY
nr:MAG TPA: hypothetical protein [Bacteriophage sp.]